MEKYICFAGITYRITVPEDQMFFQDSVLSHFEVPEGPADYSLDFRLAVELPKPEGELLFRDEGTLVYGAGDREICYKGPMANGPEDAYLRIERIGRHSTVLVKSDSAENRITTRVILSCLAAEHAVVQNHGFLLHASLIEIGGKAILFTAPSGTGKSTQADLWSRLRGAELLNGDRAAVMLRDGIAYAHGVPYSGSSGVCRKCELPVAAVVYLAQAEKTEIQKLTGIRAFSRIWEGCCVNVWNKSDLDACARAVTDCAENTPVFYLACRPDESAVAALENVL